jgi:pimeloyl-ACP methyl ester carboxylesterase
MSFMTTALPGNASPTTLFWASPTGNLAYDDQGTGPLVVCVPGMGDLRQEYRFLAPRLVEAGYRVVTVDLRGHGESTPLGTDYSVAGVGADLAGLIRHLNAGPARVLGDSMAAGASVWLAAEHPNLVDRLVLMGPFVRSEPTFWTNLLYSVLFGGFWGADAWTACYAGLYPTHKPSDFPTYTKALRDNLAEPQRMNALRAMLYASKGASESRLGLVRAPVLVLMGTKDPDFPKPEDEARWVADQLRGTYRMIEGAGHYPHAEFPEVTAPLILEFLAR